MKLDQREALTILPTTKQRERKRMSEKMFIGLEENNLHMFVSRCCEGELSVEPLSRICCGNCGKPALPLNYKEKSERRQIPESIAKGKFLLVGSGESYFTEEVKGADLVKRVMAVTCGEDESQWNQSEVESWEESLWDEDNWICSHALDAPVRFEEDIGETDHITLIRIEPLDRNSTTP